MLQCKKLQEILFGGNEMENWQVQIIGYILTFIGGFFAGRITILKNTTKIEQKRIDAGRDFTGRDKYEKK
jgi:hypothetical protein